jgi:formate dehydrogenase major subunit
MAMSDTKNTFFMDDKEIDIREGETIFRAGRRHDIKLPHLCYSPKPGYRPDGNCRVCMVEIEGERVLAASCLRTPTPGMKVKTQTDRAKTARRMVAELLLTDQPAIEVAHDPDSELWKIVKRLKIEDGRFPKRDAIEVPAPDRSHVAMAVNLDACIQCNLCVRACREVRSTTSSAWPAAAISKRSCSTSTTRWAPRPASPAASACRPARPAR